MADDTTTFSINKDYAEHYEKRKKAEELSNLQDKYGQIPSTDESSSSEEEDEEGDEDTVETSKSFLRTLSLLKKKDPRIYSTETNFYHDNTGNDSNVPSQTKLDKPLKPMFLKDYERKRLLEREEMAGISDSDSEETAAIRGNVSVEKMSYDQEQRDIKESFKRAALGLNEGVLTVRHKTEQEKQEEEAEYIKWLKGHKTELQTDEMKDMDALRRYWTDPNLDPDEAFLRDYVLNKKWIDGDTKKIAKYEEIVADFPDPSDDENEIEKQDQYEEKFNFRFEEPGGTKISSYPRKVDNSLRKTEEKRKDKRKERDERKAKEKEQKYAEIRRLKNLKKEEIMEKLEQLKKITGNPIVGFKEEDFEADFDPAHYDNMMNKQFDDEYYDEMGVVDDEKPAFSDLSEEEEDWDNWVPKTTEPHCEDPDFNMDADYNPTNEGEEPTTSKRQKRKQNIFSKAVIRNKPSYNPERDKEFEDYFDEYYKLDYEDIIGGDLPCRFHYRQTVPNNFGLTTEEVLLSEDKELNKWVSLKKAVQYRNNDEEKKDIKTYRKKANDTAKKQRILVTMATAEDDTEIKEKKGKKKRTKKESGSVGGGVSDTRLTSYGITKQKKSHHRKKK